MSGKRIDTICAWCGEEFTAPACEGRIYCCHPCAVAGRSAPGRRTGKRRLPLTDAEEWCKLLAQTAKAAGMKERETVTRLVCGSMNMNNGLDGLVSVIRYGLQQDPYDGNIYAFRDGSGTMLKYLQWDGTSFCLSKRRAQSGSYPWPVGARGTVVDISIQEWQYLLTKSIVPAKLKKPKKRKKKKSSKLKKC
jgi:transposase